MQRNLTMKKLGPWCLAALATLAPLGALGGLLGAFAAHAAILLVTLGIFFATLSLGRTQAPRPTGTPLPSVNLELPRR